MATPLLPPVLVPVQIFWRLLIVFRSGLGQVPRRASDWLRVPVCLMASARRDRVPLCCEPLPSGRRRRKPVHPGLCSGTRLAAGFRGIARCVAGIRAALASLGQSLSSDRQSRVGLLVPCRESGRQSPPGSMMAAPCSGVAAGSPSGSPSASPRRHEADSEPPQVPGAGGGERWRNLQRGELGPGQLEAFSSSLRCVAADGSRWATAPGLADRLVAAVPQCARRAPLCPL